MLERLVCSWEQAWAFHACGSMLRNSWVLPNVQVKKAGMVVAAQGHPPDNLASLHSALINAYLAQSRGSNLGGLSDDGYILQTLGHHLAWAHRLDELKDLLSNPDWLEAKLHGYGTMNVVADFRRCEFRSACVPFSLGVLASVSEECKSWATCNAF